MGFLILLADIWLPEGCRSDLPRIIPGAQKHSIRSSGRGVRIHPSKNQISRELQFSIFRYQNSYSKSHQIWKISEIWVPQNDIWASMTFWGSVSSPELLCVMIVAIAFFWNSYPDTIHFLVPKIQSEALFTIKKKALVVV